MRSCFHSVNHHHILHFFIGVYVCRIFLSRIVLPPNDTDWYRLSIFPLGLQCLFRAGCQDMVSMFVSNKPCFRGVYAFHSGTQKKNILCSFFPYDSTARPPNSCLLLVRVVGYDFELYVWWSLRWQPKRPAPSSSIVFFLSWAQSGFKSASGAWNLFNIFFPLVFEHYFLGSVFLVFGTNQKLLLLFATITLGDVLFLFLEPSQNVNIYIYIYIHNYI